MGILEIQVDARSLGRGGTRAGRPTPALRYRAALVAFSVVIYFELTHDITMECTLVAYWFSVQNALHEVLGSIPNVMHIQFFVFPCMYQYVPSTYLQIFWNPSTNKYVLGMAACNIGTYYAIVQYHLVLLCTSTYYLVQQRFTILAVLAFRFGTLYVESWTALIAVLRD